MTVLAQSSQRATWPPSATVRQRSMADITFNWSRLTCPALVLRHAAPWSRKISATSNPGRDTAAGYDAGSRSFRLFMGFLRGCESRSSGLSMPAIMPVGGSDAIRSTKSARVHCLPEPLSRVLEAELLRLRPGAPSIDPTLDEVRR